MFFFHFVFFWLQNFKAFWFLFVIIKKGENREKITFMHEILSLFAKMENHVRVETTFTKRRKTVTLFFCAFFVFEGRREGKREERNCDA